jgi:hypothetical protein
MKEERQGGKEQRVGETEGQDTDGKKWEEHTWGRSHRGKNKGRE